MTSTVIAGDWVPAECTLPTAEQPLRRRESADVFASAMEPLEWVGDREIRLRLPAALKSRTREREVSESQCCVFFGFTFSERPGGFEFAITVPAGQECVRAALAALVRPERDEP